MTRNAQAASVFTITGKVRAISGKAVKWPQTVAVRIPFEALRPFLAVVRQLLIVLQCHGPKVDRSIQTIRHVRVREHLLVEIVDDAEKRRISNDVYVVLGTHWRVSDAQNPSNDQITHRMVVN